ncbi:hypothetical protein F5J12DRAFT_725106 [Pisolithus orientalis]|uniref:uncharacterized protein n=1 Tax=Pisolithus orientalis TaxID=936130 RepID=UPI002224EEFA|nr:uncharacterized protein F5J12DRAFT_725106 [Pisolithus orientalis]KAI5997834.1 hypothetical protein F5J12DRAFT_725106 [Pisolithus orientalis]
MSFSYVQLPDLGEEFHNLLKVYFHLEGSSNFSNRKGVAHTLSSKYHPEVIHWWITHTCTGCPPILDIDKFSNDFWTWWCELQPTWRKGSMPKTAEFVPAPHMLAGGWTELNKPGLNGFLSDITALHWWGSKIKARAAQYGLWNAAVADVCWVMEQLIKSQSIDDGNPQ